MDLKTFVAETLKQIAEGIKEAQAAGTGALFAPLVCVPDRSTALHITNKPMIAVAQNVLFDVAVSVAETEGSSGEGRIKVWVVSLDANIEAKTQNSTLSRVKFEIPVQWSPANLK